MRFQGQRIVILGGTSGLGLATAKAAAEEGGSVVVVSSRSKRVDEALEQLPPTAEGRVTDLLDETGVRALFNELGGFDHLVYTAGESLQLGPIADTSIELARSALELRVWGAFVATRYAVPSIRENGSIVLTSGTACARKLDGASVL